MSLILGIATFIYIIICFLLIAVVLLQQGKGGDLAGAFGGMGTQTAFGARGATTMLHRLTVWAFVVFLILAMGLTILQSIVRTGGLGGSKIEDDAAVEAPAVPGDDAPTEDSADPTETPAPEATTFDGEAEGSEAAPEGANVDAAEAAATEAEAPADTADPGDG